MSRKAIIVVIDNGVPTLKTIGRSVVRCSDLLDIVTRPLIQGPLHKAPYLGSPHKEKRYIRDHKLFRAVCSQLKEIRPV